MEAIERLVHREGHVVRAAAGRDGRIGRHVLGIAGDGHVGEEHVVVGLRVKGASVRLLE